MKNQLFITALLISMVTTLSGCSVIGDIFKAGMGVGIFLVVLVVAIIAFIISKIAKNK